MSLLTVLLLALGTTSVCAQSEVASTATVRLGQSGPKLSSIESNVTRLNKIISVDLKNQSLEDALTKVARKADLKLTYGSRTIDKDVRVTLSMEQVTVLQALYEIVRGTGLGFKLSTNGHLIVVKQEEIQESIARSEVEEIEPIPAFQVSGVVTAATDGEPLPGVNVVVQGTAIGTATDANGRYSVSAPAAGDTLLFTFIGYEAQVVPIQGRNVIDVQMVESTESLEDVVVIGYGEKSRALLTESIGTVSSDQIEQLPVASADQALQGRISGVQVTSVDGTPGSPVAIRIRGVGTVGNTQPLFVIDGVPVGNVAGYNTNPLATINPSDIESISVLKDASAAAAYGVRAANGVVLITTKRGQWGTPKVSFDAYYGVQRMPETWDMLTTDDYVALTQEAYSNYNTQFGLTPSDANYYVLHPDLQSGSRYLDINNNEAWIDDITNDNAPIQNYNISVSGASERLNYYVSAGYFNQEATIKRWNLNRYNFRANGDYQVTPWLKIGQTFSISYQDVVRGTNAGGDGFILSSAATMPPFFEIYENPEHPIAGNRYGFAGNWQVAGLTIYNQNGANQIIDNTDRTTRLLGGMNAELGLVRGLKFRSVASVDYNSRRNDSWSPGYTGPELGLSREFNSVGDTRGDGTTLVYTNTLNYAGTFGGHTIDALGGVEYQKTTGSELGASANGFLSTDPNFYKVIKNGTTDRNLYGGANEGALLGYIGRVSYDYKNKYLITGTLRRDGSSRFSPDNRWGTFPSVSAAWRISQEPFFKNIPLISELKLRGSWGQLGNDQTAAFPYIFRVSSTPDYGLGRDQHSAQAPSPVAFVNENVTWETVETVDFGFDVSFFNDRLSLLATYYHRNTKDFLVSIPIPTITGFGSTPVNAGNVLNQGVELELNYSTTLFDELDLDFGANLTTVDNELTALTPGIEEFLSVNQYRTAVGYPIGYFYGYKTDGLYQNGSEAGAALPDETIGSNRPQPGDVRFVDTNGPAPADAEKGVQFSGEPDGKITAEDRTFLGKTIPDVFYGLNLNARFRNFDVSLFFQGLGGVQVYNAYRAGTETLQGGGRNQLATSMDRWHGEGTSDDVPRAIQTDPNSNSRFSDRFVEDASYFRLKNLQIGYTLPRRFAQNRISNARIYVSATNLLTFTKYSGLDPEVMTYGSNGSQIGQDVTTGNPASGGAGTDNGNIPQPRMFQVGLQVQF